jgi:hypothetical protein
LRYVSVTASILQPPSAADWICSSVLRGQTGSNNDLGDTVAKSSRTGPVQSDSIHIMLKSKPLRYVVGDYLRRRFITPHLTPVFMSYPAPALLSHRARVMRLDRYSRADSYDCYSTRDLLRLLTLHLEAGFVMKHNNVS